MDNRDYLKLQNGSDVRGVAIATETSEVTLDAEKAGCIAAAFLDWLVKKTGKAKEALRVGIGHDSRLSAEELSGGVVRGLRGAQIFHCGLISTPAMFLSTKLAGSAFDGAIMLTASHLPFERNGMKFFTTEGGLEKADIKELLTQAASYALPTEDVKAEAFDLRSLYCDHLKGIIRDRVGGTQPLSGLHIVLDAGNGAAGFFASEILEALGADTSGSRYLEADGHFPNHVPNPEDETAMAAIREAVLSAGADLGVIFDCDGDRAAVVFDDGEEVNRNRMIALLSAILAKDHPGATVVTDSITSDELRVFIEENLGMKQLRYQRGYKNVINKAVELTAQGIDCPLAMETSGHGALEENYYSDDGAYLSVRIICAMAQLKKEGRKLQELIADLKEPADAKELRFNILEEDFRAYGESVLADLQSYVEARDDLSLVTPNYEGVRVRVSGEAPGWFLLRLSLHDPVMPMNVESQTAGGAKQIIDSLADFFAAHDKLQLR